MGLEALIEPIVAALIQQLVTYYKAQQGENAIRKADAYGRALDAWKEVETLRTEFVPTDLVRVRDSGPGGGGLPGGGGTPASHG